MARTSEFLLINSHKTIVGLKLFLFMIIVLIIGHIVANFCEKLFLEIELTNVKSTLQHLGETVNKVGSAYDNLYNEMKVLSNVTHDPSTRCYFEKDHKSKPLNFLDRRALHDVKLKKFIDSKNNEYFKVVSVKKFRRPKSIEENSIQDSIIDQKSLKK